MIVIGKQAFLFSHSEQYSDVQDFVKEVKIASPKDHYSVMNL